MELFVLEHKRLWRSTRVLICVALCFVYCVIWQGVLRFQWTDYGTPDDPTRGVYGNKFDGYTAIQSFKAQADKYGDYFTDEVFQQMVKDYQDTCDQPNVSLQSGADWILLLDFLRLYPELEDPIGQEYQPLILYADTTKLTDFYERRAEQLEFRLEAVRQNEGMSQEDKEMLLEMNSQIEEPWRYEWTQGWANMSFGWSKMVPYLAIALGFLFSGEWHDSTAPLLHTTKHGWKKLARVKLLSGMAFALEMYLMVAVGKVAAQLIYCGIDGWDLPIQYVSMMAVAPWNMLQAELYELLFGLVGVLGYAALVMLMSALVKSNVLALVYSLAFIYVPDLLSRYLPKWLQALSQYLPLVGSSGDIYSYNIFHIFGKGIWSPWMLVTVPALIGVVSIPLAVRGWSRRQKV